MAKKRNPQDATLRNIRALKKRVSSLEIQVKYLGGLTSWLIERSAAKKKR
jgi:hypothetical protein